MTKYWMSDVEKNARDGRQQEVGEWTINELGFEEFDIKVRGRRLAEEAMEAAQAVGVPREDMLKVLEHVYGRPAGEPFQEIGGVAITLMAYGAAAKLSVCEAEEAELERVLSKPPGHFKARIAEKRAAGL